MTRRQYSPSAIVACETPPSSVSELLSGPRALAPEQRADADDHVDPDQDVGEHGLARQRAASSRTLVLWRAHSGQRMPTGVDVMQSGQIGRSQFEQRTPVSRFGCR